MNLLNDTVAKPPKCGILRQRLQAGPQLPDGFAAVSSGLIDIPDLAQGAVQIVGFEAFRHLPGVEADAMLVGDLVVEEISDGANLALKMQARAQLTRPGEGAAIAEFRKFQRHHREAVDVFAQLL